MIPSPTELTYFMEVATCLNVSRASERLGVGQPSISLAIKKLEQTMEARLFIRHKKGVSLTHAGEQLLGQVKILMDQWEKTKNLTRSSQQDVRGRITIGCRSASAYLMTDFLQFLLLKHPHIEITFNFQSSIITTDNVIQSSIDIGIVNNPLKHPDLIVQKLVDTDMAFWVGHGNKSIQNIESGDAVIFCEPNIPQTRQLLRELEKHKIKTGRVMFANSLEVIAHFITSGCGIGILPSCYATMMYPEQLNRITSWPSCPNEVCLIYRYENKQVKVVSTVLNVFREFMALSNIKTGQVLSS